MSRRAVAGAVVLVLGCAVVAVAEPPAVVSTSPANGDTGVAPDLAEIVITFSEPMNGNRSMVGDWNPFDQSWSPDYRRLILTRRVDAPDWPAGHVAWLMLNPPPTQGMGDRQGEALAAYGFAFTVGGLVDGAPAVTATVPANGADGVDTGLDRIVVDFSQPMAPDWGVAVTSPTAVSLGVTWSADRRRAEIGLSPAGGLLVPATAYSVWLNRTGPGFRDDSGRPLGAHLLVFTTAPASPDDPPMVVTLDPLRGATEVSRYTDWVSVTFSTPMGPGANVVSAAGPWQVDGASGFWDGDTVYRFSRTDAGRPLEAGSTVELVLNPDGAAGFGDAFGNPLPETAVSFRVEDAPVGYRVLKVLPGDSARDFAWPYYLWVPDDLTSGTTLLVEPNNTGTTSDWQGRHDASAVDLLRWRSSFASDLGTPLLVPTFPRPRSRWWIYTHALDRDSLLTRAPGLERVDLQLIEMIDDARDRLLAEGVYVERRVLMMGFSASGQFTNRFAILHPDRIRAAAAGSPGGWPLAPVAAWAGEVLPYNVGVADVELLTGPPVYAGCSAPMLLYMGDADTNDSVPFGDSYDPGQAEQVERLFGDTPVERWPHAERIYREAGCNATFRLYPGVPHLISGEMWTDIEAFFRHHLEPAAPRGGARRP